MAKVQFLGYEKCDTCRKARLWLDENGVAYTWRPIVEEPPTRTELEEWIPQSGLHIRKWLNTSGQSYRAIGKAKVDSVTDAVLVKWLTEDGKLVKRPVLVRKGYVQVGFAPGAYAALFATK